LKTRKFFLFVGLFLLLIGAVGTVGASAESQGRVGSLRIDVCHATSSSTNPFVLITVNIHSVESAQGVGGHGTHSDDSWESFEYAGVTYPGQGDMSDCDEPPEDPVICEDPEANNTGEEGECTYDEDPVICEDPEANNTGEEGECTYDPNDPDPDPQPSGPAPAGAGEISTLFGLMQSFGFAGGFAMLGMAIWPRKKE
jgi:hypothetical protein